MEKRKNNQNKLFILGIVLFILSLIFFLSVLIKNYSYLEKKEFLVKLEVSDVTGFDTNISALAFGKIMPGSTSVRNLIIENHYTFPIKIKIKAEGESAQFLNFEKIINLKVNETKKIEFGASIPLNTKKGNYEGEVIVILIKDNTV